MKRLESDMHARTHVSDAPCRAPVTHVYPGFLDADRMEFIIWCVLERNWLWTELISSVNWWKDKKQREDQQETSASARLLNPLACKKKRRDKIVAYPGQRSNSTPFSDCLRVIVQVYICVSVSVLCECGGESSRAWISVWQERRAKPRCPNSHSSILGRKVRRLWAHLRWGPGVSRSRLCNLIAALGWGWGRSHIVFQHLGHQPRDA